MNRRGPMDILSFAFGILAAFAVIMIAVIAVGFVKVTKLEKALIDECATRESLDIRTQESIGIIYRDMDDRFKDSYNLIEKEDTNMLAASKSYTDSRVDRVVK